MITGPSGVGKGTLIAELLDAVPELELSVSATTRDPRPGEEDGREYHFLSPVSSKRRWTAGEFLEYATYCRQRYGTLRRPSTERSRQGRSVVLEIEVLGAARSATRCRRRCRSSSSPRPRGPSGAARGTGHRLAEEIEKRLSRAEVELQAQVDFHFGS